MGLAIVLGLLLVIGGAIAKLVNPIVDVQSSMIFAIGAGLILSAFGGQANVRYGPFVLAGVPAMTAAIFFGLYTREAALREEYQKGYVQGTIKDFRTDLYDARLKNKGYLMSRVDSGEKEFNFIVLLSELSQTDPIDAHREEKGTGREVQGLAARSGLRTHLQRENGSLSRGMARAAVDRVDVQEGRFAL